MDKRKKPERTAGYRRGFLLRCLVIAGILIGIRSCLVIVPQHGSQMFPAIRDGDLILAFLPAKHYPAGAVVVYRTKEGIKRIGRIVAVPEDVVDISEDGLLSVNERIVSEEIFYPTSFEGAQIGALPLKIPEDSYYILNDHRTETDDSREYGVISRTDLCGKAFWLFRRRGF